MGGGQPAPPTPLQAHTAAALSWSKTEPGPSQSPRRVLCGRPRPAGDRPAWAGGVRSGGGEHRLWPDPWGPFGSPPPPPKDLQYSAVYATINVLFLTGGRVGRTTVPFPPTSPWEGPSCLSPISHHSRKPPAWEGAGRVQGGLWGPQSGNPRPQLCSRRSYECPDPLEVNFS